MGEARVPCLLGLHVQPPRPGLLLDWGCVQCPARPPLVFTRPRVLRRCKRPKLRVLWSWLRRPAGAELSEHTFCPFPEVSDEAVRALEG